MNSIDTDGYSARLREMAADTGGRRLLVTDLRGSAQEHDLAEPVNCGGFARTAAEVTSAHHGRSATRVSKGGLKRAIQAAAPWVPGRLARHACHSPRPATPIP